MANEQVAYSVHSKEYFFCIERYQIVIGISGVASSKIQGGKILKKFINVWGASPPTPPPNYPAERLQMYRIFLNMRIASFDKEKGNM